MKNGLIVKIVSAFMFVFLLIALVLYFAGIRHVAFDDSYYSFVRGIAIKSSSWNIKIPSIPTIPKSSNYSGFWVILNFLIDFANFIITILNVIITGLNFIISIFTTIVAIVQTLITDAPQSFQTN